MWALPLAAIMEPGQWVALTIGMMGLAGVIFTALKYNRDDTTAIVTQQSTILNDMRAMNAELREQNKELKGQIEVLRNELREAREHIVTEIRENRE